MAGDETVIGTLGRESTPNAPDQAAASHHGLLVFEKGESWMFQLPVRGSVVIGRGEAAGLRLSDQTVSRRHAVVEIDDDGATISDAGSHNGTAVNGERLSGAQLLKAGDNISICSATLLFYTSATAQSPRATGAVVPAPIWQERLGEELERALRCQRQFAVLCVGLRRPGDPERSDGAIERGLRRFDAAAWMNPRELLVLAPEVSADAAGKMAERLREVAGNFDPDARVGYAIVPNDGWDPDALVAAARAACQGAPPRGVAPAATSFGTFAIAGQRVVVADPAMSRLYAMIERIAAVDLPVLLIGETGTGKELAAAALHERSRRHTGPLVALNCAAVTESLAESELFGHERGAFSGAVAAKQGLLEAAAGGTLFLDEIAELSLAVQAKLLRVLETRRFLRVGDVREREVDVRLVAATHRDLAQEVKAGRFRQDLFYRLNGAVLRVPPLRERQRELPLLAAMFLGHACESAHRTQMKIAPDAMELLAEHDWPGNVRELKNLMGYVAAAHADATLLREHLADHLRAGRGDASPTSASAPEPAPSPPPRSGSFRPLADEMRELEIRRIAEALEASGGNQTRAAELIGMPVRTFFAKVKQYGLRR